MTTVGFIGSGHIGDAARSALPIAGDDPGARAATTEFLDRIGYDAVDAGLLAKGWRYQPDTPGVRGHLRG